MSVVKDRAQFVAKLEDYEWKKDFRDIAAENGASGLLAAVYKGVDANTFRAFRRYKQNTPSTTFRSWASEELYRDALTDLLRIRSAARYDKWLLRLARRLDKMTAKEIVTSPQILSRALKLLNLLVKRLCTMPPLWPRHYGGSSAICMCPWISHNPTLGALRKRSPS